MIGSGITRQALRRHRWSLAGPACTHVLAATVISMMITTANSLNTSLTATERSTRAMLDLLDATSVFLGGSIYMALLVVGVTMHLAMSRQLRDIALLRAIGASPGQVRRSLILQAATVSVPSAIVGIVLGPPAAALWLWGLTTHDVVPHAIRVRPSAAAAPVAIAVGLVTSIVGSWIAVARGSRVPPATAITEASTGRRNVTPIRAKAGIALIAAALTLSATLATVAPDQTGDASFFVLLAQCIGIGLLGPTILRAVARIVQPFTHRGLGRVAVDDLTTMSRSLSGALVPLIFATAFATIKVAVHTTNAAVNGVPDLDEDLWTEYSGTVIYCAFAGVAALNCFLTVVIARRRDLAAIQLVGGSRRALVAINALQTVIVSATAITLSALVALATLAPILHQSLHVWTPRVPITIVSAGTFGVLSLVAIGIVAPAAILTNRPPIRVVSSNP